MAAYKTKRGFTLMELMITIAIMAILVTTAVPTSFFKTSKGTNYADIALNQAKSYVNYINDNYTQYYTQAQSGMVTIPYATVIASGYNGAVSNTDSYGAAPCATLTYNASTKKLAMFMYYVGGSAVDTKTVNIAVNNLNGLAAQLNGTTYVGAFGAWSIASASIIGSCGSPNANTMAINLNLLTTQVSQMKNDNSLHRVLDTSGSSPGTAANTNTMQTDIIMGYSSPTKIYKGIYFTESNSPTTGIYLTSGANSGLASPYNTGVESDIVITNATLVAKSFQATESALPLTQCQSTQLGKIVLDATATSSANVVANLQCSYDTINCSSTYSYYCYAPVVKSLVRQTSVLTDYTCPAGSYLDLSVPPMITPFTPTATTQLVNGSTIPITCTAWLNVGPTTYVTGTPDANGRISTITGATNWMGLAGAAANCTNGTIYATKATVSIATCTNYVTYK